MLAPPNSCISVALCIKPRNLLFRYVRLPRSLDSRRVPLAGKQAQTATFETPAGKRGIWGMGKNPRFG
jgi:hypothetical protein